jgi:hypothetical protein
LALKFADVYAPIMLICATGVLLLVTMSVPLPPEEAE